MSTCVNDPIKTLISKTPSDNLRQMPRKSATMSFFVPESRDLSEWLSSIDSDTDIKKNFNHGHGIGTFSDHRLGLEIFEKSRT